jgi:hypothetical protein
MALPGVAQLGAKPPLERRVFTGCARARRFELAFCIGAQLGVYLCHAVPVDVLHQRGIRPRAVDARGRRQQPEAGAGAGSDRREHARNLELSRDFDHMDGAGAAGRDHGELARIVALLGDMDARSGRHVLIHDVADAPGDLGRGELELSREAFKRGLCEVFPQLHVAAEEVLGVEVAQDEIGVGDSGPGAALTVARRTRIGAGALGADVEQAQLVHVRDGAAARADLDEIDAGHENRQARAAREARDARALEAVRDERFAADRDARFRGRAAQIESEDLGYAVVARRVESREHAADGARFQQQDRRFGRGLA